MGRRKPQSFTPEQEDVMVQAKTLGMPNDQVAALLRVSTSTYERYLKKNATLRDRIGEARYLAALKARHTLFNLATKKQDFQALKFYLQTQEGYRITDRVEHTGADGRPIRLDQKTTETKDPTKEEILAELRDLNERLAVEDKG